MTRAERMRNLEYRLERERLETALLCLDGPDAGLMCTEATMPAGYVVRPAEEFEGFTYPAAAETRPGLFWDDESFLASL